MLTQKEVDNLTEGTIVRITWSGGNGPHKYIIGKHYGNSWVRDSWTGQLRGIITFVGETAPFTIVELISD